ncbi:MAG TPA: hypothetical protein VNS09_08050 [Solirubrobacter sp.]|nr:hypothetical protein [Solirubrobacter sp.]
MHGRACLAALAATLLLAAPAGAEVPAGNLLVNGDAEAAPGATDDSTQVPIPGWTVDSTFTAVSYATGSGFLTPENAAEFGGGANFFAGGPGGEVASASQVVDVSRAAPEIDAGLDATLSALLGGFAGQQDSATVSATPLDAAGASLAAPVALPPVTAQERDQNTELLRRTATFRLPAGTRAIRVTITATRTEGFYNDGYADNVRLTLGAGGSAVAGRSVEAREASGTVLVRVPGSRKFVPLADTAVRNGAEIDARKGAVVLTRSDGGAATFSSGVFKVSHTGGVTTLTLSQKLTGCRKARRATATASARKVKTRKLWGSGKGRFATRGQYGAATVRGTRWLTSDTCTATTVRVTEGAVKVRDLVKRRTVLVHAGGRYTARARRR